MVERSGDDGMAMVAEVGSGVVGDEVTLWLASMGVTKAVEKAVVTGAFTGVTVRVVTSVNCIFGQGCGCC